MKAERKPLFQGQSAAYPSQSASEAHSKHTLMDLLDKRYVRGELRIMDKYPNADGILDITDAQGHIKGKIDIQLKTLSKKRVKRPTHACDKDFLIYCQDTTLPVILIAVDQIGRKAYWQHMSYEVLADISNRMTGKTYSLALPVENCIDGKSLAYVEKWMQLCKSTYDKVWNYDALEADNRQLELELLELKEKFGPLTLDAQQVKEIQEFLDLYNYLLDNKFHIIKQVRYSNYWKIGLGIMHYTPDECSFIVYPIPYGTNEPLIRQIKPGSIKDIDLEFFSGNILQMQSSYSDNPIYSSPEKLAYKMLNSDFEYVIKRIQFDIPDDFMANEYIHGFVSHFATFLDLETGAESYDLKHLHYLANEVIPLLIELHLNFLPDGPKRITYNIDSFKKLKPHPNHRHRLKEAKDRAANGYEPKIEIIPTSESFHLDILRFYIDHLLNQGITHTRRVYDPNIHNTHSTSNYIWDTWNYKVLTSNLSVVMANLKRVYKLLIDRYFSNIEADLNLFNDGNLILYCLTFEYSDHAGPVLEYYKMRSRNKFPNEVRFCTDAERPFTHASLMEDKGWTIRINRKIYDLHVRGGHSFSFMFDPTPMHGFISQLVSERITQVIKNKMK